MPIHFAAMEDHIADGAPKTLSPCLRVVFIRQGSVHVTSSDGSRTMSSGTCALFSSAITLSGAGECWTFEISAERSGALSTEEQSRLVFATTIGRDPSEDVLIRADRVDFPPGAVTPRHGHKGPGIRRLIEGRLLAEIGSKAFRIDAGDVWFEAGPDPVVGRTLTPHSSFVRVMILDPALKDQPTFIPCSPEDAIKPRGTSRTLFFDTVAKIA